MKLKRHPLRSILLILAASSLCVLGCESKSESDSEATAKPPVEAQPSGGTPGTAETPPPEEPVDNTADQAPAQNADPAKPGGSKLQGGTATTTATADPKPTEAKKELAAAAPEAEEAPALFGTEGGGMGGGGAASDGFGIGVAGKGSGSGWKGDSKSRKKKPARDWDRGDDSLGVGGEWGGSRPPEVVRPKPNLTAGETDDNDNFEAFQKFLAERPKPYLEEMDVSERMFIRVLDAKNRPLPNTTVTFKASGQNVFTGKTYADGSVLFHPKSFAAAAQAQSFDLTFQHGSTSLDYTIKRGAKESWEVRMPLERSLPARPQVDVVFLLDTTGSMGDEIERLQQTILQISDQVSNLQGNPEPRFGLVLYRDDGEEYVSQLHDFTPDVNTFKRTLSAVTADGGGDTPERLEVGLHRSVHEMNWGAQSTRLVFLVADAPPHRADQNEHSYARDIQAAVGKGIKVYPVASSGLNDDGEYVLRQLAQYTMAKFLFLTYGASGTSTPHDIPKDSFQPTTLDGLIIKIIRTEIQALQLDKGGISQQ